MKVLGISCYYHDSAATLIVDGKIVAAAQEERFTRKKHDENFPHQAIQYCLNEANINISDIDIVAYYEKPFLKFERLLETYLEYAPKGFVSFAKAIPSWLKKKLWIEQGIQDELGFKGKIVFVEHHKSHAASAFFASPFEKAAVITIDGVGEWTTTSWGVGDKNTLTLTNEIRFPHSLGLLYSAFTHYLGFKVNSGEYKVMGLAPYGKPTYVDLIYKNLIEVKPDGSFMLDMAYFNYPAGLTMTNKKFHDLFGAPPRAPESELTSREMDIAASLQVVTEEIMLKIAHYVHKETGLEYACLAGGVALNCVANGRILREGPFKDIWIQPASGDAGGALGSALSVWYEYLGNERHAHGSDDMMQGSYLGPSFSNEAIAHFIDAENLVADYVEDGLLFNQVAQLLAQGNVVGWFGGRMEFGPRALGHRSILGDARNTEMQTTMNLKIKFRESFRPFAPAILNEDANQYFILHEHSSPYMLLTTHIRDEYRTKDNTEDDNVFGIQKLRQIRSTIPAVTHVDYSARVQTVTPKSPRFYKLLQAFKKQTGCPVLVNTSFNVRGEPIVCTPQDAYQCFMRTHMDYLVLENYIFTKNKQPDFKDNEDWQKAYELD